MPAEATRGSTAVASDREGCMSTGSGTPFGGTRDKTVAGSKPWWPQTAKPPQGAPNILVVLFDDVGFSDFGCYGSAITTPTIETLPPPTPRRYGLPPTPPRAR